MTGQKFDEGKERWDLIPLTAMQGLAKVLTYGAKEKYKEWGWLKVENAKARYYSAMMRHFVGMVVLGMDPDSKLPHADHFLANAVFLRELYEKERQAKAERMVER